MIAFMGEERVLRGGDNVLVAATEASLSEIKHDEGLDEDRRGRGSGEEAGDEGNPTLPSRFSSPPSISSAAFVGFQGWRRGWCTFAFTRADVKTAVSGVRWTLGV